MQVILLFVVFSGRYDVTCFFISVYIYILLAFHNRCQFSSQGRTVVNSTGSLELHTSVLQEVAPPCWSSACPGPGRREGKDESNQLIITNFP